LALVVCLGILIGAVMGLTGAGGGILAVPVLVAGLHWTMQQAAPVALIAVASGAAIGALDGFRHRLVRYKAGALMAVFGIPLTRVGQTWAQLLPQYLLVGGFGCLMLLVSWRFFKQSLRTQAAGEEQGLRLAFINPETGRFIWTPAAAAALATIGMLTGLMTGLLGVGGGFLIVPLMKQFTQLALPGIVATSLFVITLVGSGGVANSILAGAQLPVVETSGFVGAMVLGMVLGRLISHRLRPNQIQRSFALLLFCVAVFMLVKAYSIQSAFPGNKSHQSRHSVVPGALTDNRFVGRALLDLKSIKRLSQQILVIQMI
jgi:uncharacterized membrane protein YfcA